MPDVPSPFPNLDPSNARITSSASATYNCVAWAAGDTTAWWWPEPQLQGYHWPPGVPRNVTLQSFVLAFEHLGYRVCTSGMLEEGVEKIALYAASDGEPTHAARQLANGGWTSKLGMAEENYRMAEEAVLIDNEIWPKE